MTIWAKTPSSGPLSGRRSVSTSLTVTPALPGALPGQIGKRVKPEGKGKLCAIAAGASAALAARPAMIVRRSNIETGMVIGTPCGQAGWRG